MFIKFKEDLSIKEQIEKTVENLTIYGHLRRYLGGEILIASLLKDDIGKKAPLSFKQTLEKFIHASREIGAKPVLITFATKYNINNYKQMTHDEKLWLLRYNGYLSPKGWINTVAEFNKIIKQTAIENNIPCIDLAKHISGKKDLFTDFVHFTKNGHKIIGELLATKIMNII